MRGKKFSYISVCCYFQTLSMTSLTWDSPQESRKNRFVLSTESLMKRIFIKQKMTVLVKLKKFFLIVLLVIPVFYIYLRHQEFMWQSVPVVHEGLINVYKNETKTGPTHNDSDQTRRKLVDKDFKLLEKSKYKKENNSFLVLKRELVINLNDVNKSVSNVFFVESNCATEKLAASFKGGGQLLLNPRQCCAVESAATSNLDRRVYILHTCPLVEDFLQRVPQHAIPLLAIPNVFIIRYNLTAMFLNSPVEDLVLSKRMEHTQYPVEHASDVLRFTVLWKYGGTYMDLDIISLRSLRPLGNNFCGMESDSNMGSAVLNFSPMGGGHQLLERGLRHLNRHFDGNVWTANGPDLITNLSLQECGGSFENLANCTTFSVYNHHIFYPIYYWHHEMLFDPAVSKEVTEYIKKVAFVVHVWNKMTWTTRVRVGSDVAYGLLADEFCPNTYRNCGEEF